jgi:hypothetical protein
MPDEPAEEVPDQAVSQLNEGLKVCHKVMSEYRAALLRKPTSTAPLQLDEPDQPIERD